ncbi:MAG: tRNA (guanosine(37)-N1)-methyltransferase TrmD [Burkholderiaceae bacterium]|jgi:tRNA (guanine37-N1)-methyltransferase|nr:tRNA (guanosine(37)-N1)-methyltransferase TrmD [Burkholderiaceae bacterium]
MYFDVVTLFPEMFSSLTQSGVTRRAFEEGRCALTLWNPRDFATDRYRTVDDRPYGGGPGMVMQIEPLEKAIAAARQRQCVAGVRCAHVICLSPQGDRLTHDRVMALKEKPGLILLCGRYEGIDQRVIDLHVDEEISMGDFVLSGGEIPAMALMDALIRQLPQVLHDDLSAEQDSFVAGILDCPHYTRPPEYAGLVVPPVLLGGNHAEIATWRREQALLLTQKRRPDLIEQARAAGRLSLTDEAFLKAFPG